MTTSEHSGLEHGVGSVRNALRQEALARVLAVELPNEQAEAAWRLIEPAQRILLLPHVHPDPDALGSCLGFAHALTPLGKTCVVACEDPVPEAFSFLPGWKGVVSALPDEDFDLVIALDAGDLSRYGAITARNEAFFARATILNMDHHVTSTGCGQVNIIEPRFAATAELVTVFLLNRGIAITRDAAICLLAGVITDTRSFEFDATTPVTLTVGAYLVGQGAVPERIIKPVYRMKPLAKARLWGQVLPSIEATHDGKLVWATLRLEDYAKTGATGEMDEGLASYLVDIDGVGLALLFKEQADGTTRVNLRSAAPYDAAALAKHFGGGGHVRAAGCTVEMPIDEAKAEMLAYVKRVIGAE